jgi:hypothetical protein
MFCYMKNWTRSGSIKFCQGSDMFIPDLGSGFLSILDPGLKRALTPGSATLVRYHLPWESKRSELEESVPRRDLLGGLRVDEWLVARPEHHVVQGGGRAPLARQRLPGSLQNKPVVSNSKIYSIARGGRKVQLIRLYRTIQSVDVSFYTKSDKIRPQICQIFNLFLVLIKYW